MRRSDLPEPFLTFELIDKSDSEIAAFILDAEAQVFAGGSAPTLREGILAQRREQNTRLVKAFDGMFLTSRLNLLSDLIHELDLALDERNSLDAMFSDESGNLTPLFMIGYHVVAKPLGAILVYNLNLSDYETPIGEHPHD